MSTTTAYAALREAIITGQLPPNSRLVEAELSNMFGMSRGAIRTALIQLDHDGLVVREPHRGARVRLVSDQEAIEILQARAALEGLAARQTALRIDDDGRARLWSIVYQQQRLLARGDLLAASAANAQLHATLIDLSGHRTAQGLIARLRSQTVRLQFRTILLPGRSTASYREHRTIVEAVTTGDCDGAEQATRNHLFAVADALTESVTVMSTTRGAPHAEEQAPATPHLPWPRPQSVRR
jgi:DNA-binding GntR family transcriptional regulator